MAISAPLKDTTFDFALSMDAPIFDCIPDARLSSSEVWRIAALLCFKTARMFSCADAMTCSFTVPATAIVYPFAVE